jgi:hypothetical protein
MSQISSRVQEELNNAASSLRNALSFAARVEKPSTIRHLGTILQQIEDVQVLDKQADFAMQLQNSFMQRMNFDGDTPTF